MNWPPIDDRGRHFLPRAAVGRKAVGLLKAMPTGSSAHPDKPAPCHVQPHHTPLVDDLHGSRPVKGSIRLGHPPVHQLAVVREQQAKGLVYVQEYARPLQLIPFMGESLLLVFGKTQQAELFISSDLPVGK